MKRALAIALSLAALGCRKAPEEATPPPLPAPADAAHALAPGESGVHPADQLRGATEEAKVAVTEALVARYLAYRRLVVDRGQAAVKAFRERAQASDENGEALAASVRVRRASEDFAVRMRAVEESARVDARLSRDEVEAVGRVASEVFSARQIWRMSGGDASLEKARAELASHSGDGRAGLEKALARQEQGHAEMREARAARRRFGDAAVDAVLAHEKALWKVQQDGARVMAEVY